MKQFFLFQKGAKGLSIPRQVSFWLYHGVLYLLANVGLGIGSLWFATGEYGQTMFDSYFEFPTLIWLNVLPVVLLGLLLYFALGRPWLAFLLNGIVVMGLTFVNYFKLLFRNDPLLFADLTLIREAGDMAGKYAVVIQRDMWIAIGSILAVSLLFFFFLRGRPNRWVRLGGAVVVLLAAFLLRTVYLDDDLYEYDAATDNSDQISRWSDTQVYLSKGMLYPFLHSIAEAVDTPPKGYDEEAAAQMMEGYEDADIPEEQKVNVISVMLGAYTDLSRLEEVNLATDVYRVYHELEEEGVAGNLITNIFAGGTVDTERCYLTGYSQLKNFRTNTNAYPWYFRQQGYTVEGSHPCFEWFYNRENVNQYLGFEDYYYVENHYGQFTDGDVALDDVLFPEIIQFYEQNKEETGKPYFSFNVSYQGHGPYDDSQYWWGEKGTYIVDDGTLPDASQCILENYLGSIYNTNQNLEAFFDYFRQSDDPTVIVLFGDHKPWLGDDSSVYADLGINLDLSTEEGFYNYYSTRYLIWANDAAKEALGQDFSGEGPEIGPYFLMAQVFEECGWQGPAFMQATQELKERVPVLHASGLYEVDGELIFALEPEEMDLVGDYNNLQYYWRKHFQPLADMPASSKKE